MKQLLDQLRWLFLHYPRVPEGRDGLLLKLYDRWSVQLTPTGRAAVGSLLLLMMVEMLPGLSPIFPILLLLLVLLAIDLLRTVVPLRATATTPRELRAFPGDTLSLSVRWSVSRSKLPTTPKLSRLPDGARLLSSPAYHPQSGADATVELQAVRRGVWSLNQLRIAERGGLQLADRWSSRAEPITLIIRPRPLPISSIAPLHRALDSLLRQEQLGAPQAAILGEFHSLREYRTGDPLRSIHPRSSAKRGKPIVRLDEELTLAGEAVSIAIDLRIDSLPERRAFEGMLSLAAGWAVASIQRDLPVELLFFGEKKEGEQGEHHPSCESDPLLDQLAAAHPLWRRNSKRQNSIGLTALIRSQTAKRGWILSTSSHRTGALPVGWRGVELYHQSAPKELLQGWSAIDVEPWGVSDR